MVLTTIPEHYPITYQRNFMHELQQKDTRFSGSVFRTVGKGGKVKFNRLLKMTANTYTGRGGQTVYSDADTEHRWAFPKKADIANMLDEFDGMLLQDIEDPKNPCLMAQSMAIKRKMDDIIVAGITATAYEGENGTTAVTLATSSTHGVAATYQGELNSAATCGLNFYKMARAKYLLDVRENPMEGRYFALGAQQELDLVNDILDNHADDAASVQMVSGNTIKDGFMGFTFIRSQRLAENTSTDIRTCLAWQRDSVGMGVWNDPEVHIDILPTYRHAIGIRTAIQIGVARIEEDGVVAVFCDESP